MSVSHEMPDARCCSASQSLSRIIGGFGESRWIKRASLKPSVRNRLSVRLSLCLSSLHVPNLPLSLRWCYQACLSGKRHENQPERDAIIISASLSFDLLWRRHKTQGDGEGGRSWEHLHICTTDRHPTGLKAGTTTCARPHRRSANAAHSQRLIRESLGLQLVQQSCAADFLEKVWKCPWVPAKMWQRCYALPFVKKRNR